MASKSEIVRVKNFPDYGVDRNGFLYSFKRGEAKRLNPAPSSGGYLRVKLSNDKVKQFSIVVHRLVAETFLPKSRGKNIVNHKDGNKTNNSVSNLEWTDTKGNNQHYRTQLEPVYKVRRQKAQVKSNESLIKLIKFTKENFQGDYQMLGKIISAATE